MNQLHGQLESYSLQAASRATAPGVKDLAAVLVVRFLRSGGREMLKMMGGGPDDMAGHAGMDHSTHASMEHGPTEHSAMGHGDHDQHDTHAEHGHHGGGSSTTPGSRDGAPLR